jgi:hypothetical protein
MVRLTTMLVDFATFSQDMGLTIGGPSAAVDM